MPAQFKTYAPFLINHKWVWRRWTSAHGNKHEAILEKAQEFGAQRWDFGQAEHTRIFSAYTTN